jgi:hypothetical protein
LLADFVELKRMRHKGIVSDERGARRNN